MTRLHRELQRLYLPADAPAEGWHLTDAEGRVRALVLELARPADWGALSAVWNGVQTELQLPAPAIAVSGSDGVQLWFSLAQPVAVARALAFLECLRQRWLAAVQPHRVRLLPRPDPASAGQVLHAGPVPALQAGGAVWSAFVAPDLAPVFAEEPWLDTPPNPQGQSDLLSRLVCIPPADFERAEALLAPATAQPLAVAPPDVGADVQPAAAAASTHARRFLLGVMNDDSVPLALRIEAAKALLPGTDRFDSPGRPDMPATPTPR